MISFLERISIPFLGVIVVIGIFTYFLEPHGVANWVRKPNHSPNYHLFYLKLGEGQKSRTLPLNSTICYGWATSTGQTSDATPFFGPLNQETFTSSSANSDWAPHPGLSIARGVFFVGKRNSIISVKAFRIPKQFGQCGFQVGPFRP